MLSAQTTNIHSSEYAGKETDSHEHIETICAVIIPPILTFVIGIPHLPLRSVCAISVLIALVAGFAFARKPGRSVNANLLRAIPWRFSIPPPAARYSSRSSSR